MNWTEDQLAERNARVFGSPLPCGHPATAAGVCGIPWCKERGKEQKPHKYGVAPKEQRTVGSLTFDSKAEATAYQTLLLLQQSGEVAKIELQPEFKFPMGFAYRADFRVLWANGNEEVIDVKGMETPVFKLKAKCLKFFYPDVKLRLWK